MVAVSSRAPFYGVKQLWACGPVGREARLAAAADVMRSRKKLLLTLVSAVAAAAVVWFAWGRHPTPALSVTVLGYTNVSIPPQDGGAKGDWIRAEVGLKNEGPVTVYVNYSGVFDWLSVQTASGRTTCPPRPGAGWPFVGILPPGSNATFLEWLPAGTLRWQCGLSVRAPGFWERAASKLGQSRWVIDHNLYRAYITAVYRLRDTRVPPVQVKSGWFEVGAASNTPPQRLLLQPAAAAPGR
jgi:hypothetical protein